jgi:hypothetical protein
MGTATGLRIIAGFGVLLLAVSPASGQPAMPPESADHRPPVYQIEVLVFAHNEFNGQEEQFLPELPQWPAEIPRRLARAPSELLQRDAANRYLELLASPRGDSAPITGAAPATVPQPERLPAGGIATDPTPPGTTSVDSGAPGSPDLRAPAAALRAGWYRRLSDDELVLDRAGARLSNLGAYTPILHAGWAQPAVLENDAEAFDLASLGVLRPAGTVRLHLSRFLHLTLDLSLQSDYRYRQLPSSEHGQMPGRLAEYYRPARYVLQVQRRVRGGELHFFDHPAFGILIMVRPDPGAAAEVGEAASPAA